MSGRLHLSSGELQVEIDPGGGADVLSIVHSRTGLELLFATPWRERAESVRSGRQMPISADATESWMEQYRGGWQTLFPNAGPPRHYRGATFGFHGEASRLGWSTVHSDGSKAALSVALFTVPMTIDRKISVDGGILQVVDIITNTSDIDFVVDYSHHPAFGGEFLAAGCTVASNATNFVPDPSSGGPMLNWPDIELTALPSPGSVGARFGWLTGFPSQGESAAWASVTNPRLGLTAKISWDPSILPYAWWWQEFNSSRDFPWFGKARVFAIEPSSTQTSGPERASVLAIPAHGSVRIPVRLAVAKILEAEPK